MFCDSSSGSGTGYPHIANAVGAHKHYDNSTLSQSDKHNDTSRQRKNERTSSRVKVSKVLDKIVVNNPQLISKLPFHHKHVLAQIQKCAKEEFGYVISVCDDCGHQEYLAPCACNNRNCPSCGGLKRQEWLEKISDRFFAEKYFHVVFTLPHELNSLILKHQKELLNLLSQEAAKTLLKFSHDPKWLGGTPFLMTVLHTWTQDLRYHPHIHCLISAGALSDDMERWIEPKNKNFLFPVRALSRVFRASFLEGLKTLINEGKVVLEPQYQNNFGIIDFIARLPEKWNVYSQPPYKGKDVVLKYMAQYTNRSAISDSRIEKITETEIYIKPKRDSAEPDFNEKDSSNSQAKKMIVLTLLEFFRRFLLHILPKGFHRIRHYGLASPNCSKKKLDAAKKLLDGKSNNKNKNTVELMQPSPCIKCLSLNTGIVSLRIIQNKKTRERRDTS